MKKLLKEKNGITLVALVITIVILIILAGVLINITLGDNGLFTRTKLAKQKYEYGAAKEIIDLKLAEIYAECMTNGTEYNLNSIAESIGQNSEISVDIIHFYQTAKNTSDNNKPSSIEGILVIANKYKNYEFLIGQKTDGKIGIKGVTIRTGDIPQLSQFTEIEDFEKLNTPVAQTAESNIPEPTSNNKEVTLTNNQKPIFITTKRNSKTTISLTGYENAVLSEGEPIIGTANSSKMAINGNVLTTRNSADTSDMITLDVKENDNLINKIIIYVEPTIKDNAVTDENGENPKPAYEIYNEQDLVRFGEIVNNVDCTVNGILMKELDLSIVCHDEDFENDIPKVSWSPIGQYNEILDKDMEFQGIFDGNYKTISNLTIIEEQPNLLLGLFGACGNNAIVKNTILNQANIQDIVTTDDGTTGGSNVGGLCGNTRGIIKRCAVKNSTIRNECVRNGYTYSGGIAGKITNGTIEECANINTSVVTLGKQNSTNREVFTGGIVGLEQTTNATDVIIIQNCYNDGNVTSYYGLNAYAGGIAGRMARASTSASVTINKVYNRGTISASGARTTNYIGGVVGKSGWDNNSRRNFWF